MDVKRIFAALIASIALMSMPMQICAAETEAEEKEPVLTVTLDPGHGYNREKETYTGAAGAMDWGGQPEDFYNWDIAQHCKARLEDYGVKVYLTKRGVDDNPSLESRVNTAVRNGSQAFISIHNNSSSKPTAKGSQIYTVNPNYNAKMYRNTDKLANAIMKRLNEDAGTHKNTDPYYYNSQSGSTHPDGSIQEYYGVLWRAKRYSQGTADGDSRNSKLMAGMIVECVFQSNESDVKGFLLKPEKIEAMGIAIADGIADHYELTLLSEIVPETEPETEAPETQAPETEPTVEKKSNTAVTVIAVIAGVIAVAGVAVAVVLYLRKKR